MLDIKEVYPDFQKLNKTENCIVIQLKSDQKIAITSPVSSASSLFMSEIDLSCLLNSQVLQIHQNMVQ